MTTTPQTRGPRNWIGPAADVAGRAGDLRSAIPGLPEPLSLVLAGRGIDDPAAARAFLRPRLDHLHDPFGLPDMADAVTRLESAIASDETILVHGDFDADGMCATALVVRGLRRLGANPVAHVPHRTNDGYDLRLDGVERAAAERAGLIVTVDCGVTAVEAVAEAKRRGIDVVVTDHHRPGPKLPEAAAVVDPHRTGVEVPFADLAGVGVAFKLLAALFARRGVPEEELYQHLDLVAIGTLSDRMPLVDENRVLVRMGLRALERTRKPGLRALLRRAHVDPRQPIDAEDVAFRIGPRLNSVGRMASAETGVRLLVSDDPGEADELADHLDEQNVERRRTDRLVSEAAERQLADRPSAADESALVVWADDWHRGVVGIVASRLVDRWRRPAVVVSFDGDVGQGSARSVDGFHLLEALRACDGLLETYGGHRMAAGLSVRRDRIEEFAARLRDLANERFEADPNGAHDLAIDLEIDLGAVNADLEAALRPLAPHGAGNPLPVLAARSVRLDRLAAVGPAGTHLRATLTDGVHAVPAIGFGMGSRLADVRVGDLFDAAFHLERDTWRGRDRLRARLVDIRPAVA